MSEGLRKSCVQRVRSQWVRGGANIHNIHSLLWTNNSTTHVSPAPSTTPSALSTQIIHMPVDTNNRLLGRFSAESTAITITTTIYI